MSGSFDQQGHLEIADGRIILAVGKKKSGKSILAKVLFDSYPGDKIVIDVAGDDGPFGDSVVDLHGTAEDLPRRWPEQGRQEDPQGRRLPMTLRYMPNPESSTMTEDMDAIIGLGMAHGAREHDAGRIGCAVLVHEVDALAPVNRTPPHMRRALRQNRHNQLTLILCGPRPKVIDPLVVQQSDLIYTFELLNPSDRKRLAETMGWHPADFDTAVHELRRHEYLRFDANEDAPQEGEEDVRLVRFQPLPEDVIHPHLT